MAGKTEKIIEMDNAALLNELFGNYDSNVNELQKALGVKVFMRGGEVKITGSEEAVGTAVKSIETLLAIAQ